MLPSSPNLSDNPTDTSVHTPCGNESTATSQSLSTIDTPSNDDHQDHDHDEPFFADATLDIHEAHQIAELPTPEILSSRSRSLGSTITCHIPQPPRLTAVLSNGSADDEHEAAAFTIRDSLEMKHDNGNNGNNVNNQRRVDTVDCVHSSNQGFGNLSTYRPRAPRRARDVIWAISFLFYIPLSLILVPHLLAKGADPNDIDRPPLVNWYHFGTIPLIISSLLGVILARILYLTHGGGDGDDVRSIASRLMIGCNFLTCLTSPILTLQIYYLDIHDSNPFTIALLIGWIIHSIREVSIFSNQIFSSLGSRNNAYHSREWMGRLDVEGASPEIQGQRTFVRELTHVTLDVLSRSLRCQSFYRVLCLVVAIQGVLVFFLRGIYMQLSVEASSSNGGSNVLGGRLGFGMALVGGFWVCNACIKILGLLASGGITAWFAQQSLLLQEVHNADLGLGAVRDQLTREDLEYGEVLSSHIGNSPTSIGVGIMPDAYRTVDASAYTSVIDFDDGLDDDYEELELSPTRSQDSMRQGRQGRQGKRTFRSKQKESKWTGGGSDSPSTVKSFLFMAMTTSFGSIAQCALLSWLAQFIWWFTHELERLAYTSRRYLPLRPGGFRGMAVGAQGSEPWSQRLKFVTRRFVRNRTDLALCHVAAYFKSYQKAANDVMALVDGSGKYKYSLKAMLD
jgi:hypothetical protein